MEIVISEQAIKWFKEEVGLQSGDKIRFYVKIYGSSPVQDGYTLAFTKEDPLDIAVSTEAEGILFFIEEADLWFFDGHNLHVNYHEQEDELEYNYIKA
ncbi:HesB/YadR/YfhF family protein [Neobacillus muris]|uniref:HesB/YadR/YfhF family protein n=1 Tax=Neobacillus muris TaxID=2941334 RepID=UPI00203C0C8C|nr:HesB/YadR/YfhF family protein [Neobacillus muris]